MTKKWLGTWPAQCSLCGTSLAEEKYFVDGIEIESRRWALMCPSCFKYSGEGLGTGRGQKYDSKTLEKLEG
ncbi:MAG: hypothetical protein KKD44_28375 [Proteobacteria bacterium]|nr:hypothetical protein [Pseudomonadota bacterium]